MTRAARRWIAAACLLSVLAGCALPAVGPSRRPDTPAALTVRSRPAPLSAAIPKPGTVTPMSLDSFYPLQQSATALIYDVRPGFSYRISHIPGARSWPASQFDAQIASREAEMSDAKTAKHPVMLYCSDLSCQNSTKVATRLAALGHSVSILEGGYAAWKTAELPSE